MDSPGSISTTSAARCRASCRRPDCAVWSPLYRNVKPDDVAAARALGLKVIPWTVNERADMERLIALGVDGIITDYPDRLRAVMAAKDMPLPPQVDGALIALLAAAALARLRPPEGSAERRMTNPYDIDLDRNPANFQPLTPLHVPGARGGRLSASTPRSSTGRCGAATREFYARARQLASALAKRGIKRGDTVSVMLANTPAMLEAHYGVPMTRRVLNTLNTRLDAAIDRLHRSIMPRPRC